MEVACQGDEAYMMEATVLLLPYSSQCNYHYNVVVALLVWFDIATHYESGRFAQAN